MTFRRPGRRGIAALGALAVLLAIGVGLLVWRAARDGELVTMQRSGGFTGITVRLVVYQDGQVRVRGVSHPRAGARLPGSRMAELHAVLTRADFAHMRSEMDTRLRDFPEYRITYRRWTVVTNTPAHVPGLAPVVDWLTALLNEYNT